MLAETPPATGQADDDDPQKADARIMIAFFRNMPAFVFGILNMV